MTVLTEQNLPGLSVAVGVGGDIVWAEGFGWADLEKRVPVAPETRFRIGDASIALTSAAVGLLLEKGRLNLDDEIQTYVPAFPEKQWPVTLRQLMGHWRASGRRAVTRSRCSEHCERTVDGLQRFAESPLLFEPGTQYRYSTLRLDPGERGGRSRRGRAVLRVHAHADLRAAGHGRHDARLRDRTDPGSGDLLLPEVRGDTRYGPELAREVDYSCFAGAGAFLSTPSDLVRFGMAISSGKLLKPATVEMLQTPQRLTSGEETGYGLGWNLETVPLAGEPTRMAGYGGPCWRSFHLVARRRS